MTKKRYDVTEWPSEEPLPAPKTVKRYMGVEVGGQHDVARTAMYFQKAQMANLRILSTRRGSPVAEIVRRAVAEYLDKHRNEWA